MDDLLAIALIGTAKQPRASAESPCDQLVHSIESVPPEERCPSGRSTCDLSQSRRKTSPAPIGPRIRAPLDSDPFALPSCCIIEEFLRTGTGRAFDSKPSADSRKPIAVPPELLPRVLGERHPAVREAMIRGGIAWPMALPVSTRMAVASGKTAAMLDVSAKPFG